MKIKISQLRKIIREEVERVNEMSSSPLKGGGVVNRESGQILVMDSVPPEYLDRYLNHIEQYLDQYRDHVKVDEMGYTTLPNKQFNKLSDELKGLSRGNQRNSGKPPINSIE